MDLEIWLDRLMDHATRMELAKALVIQMELVKDLAIQMALKMDLEIQWVQ